MWMEEKNTDNQVGVVYSNDLLSMPPAMDRECQIEEDGGGGAGG